MDDLVSLLKILPDGLSVTAVIIVVILFLKHINDLQEKFKETVETLKESSKNEVMLLSTTFNDKFSRAQEDVAKLLDKLVAGVEHHNKLMEDISEALTKKGN